MDETPFDPTFDGNEHTVGDPKCCSLEQPCTKCGALVHYFCGYGYVFRQCENGHEV